MAGQILPWRAVVNSVGVLYKVEEVEDPWVGMLPGLIMSANQGSGWQEQSQRVHVAAYDGFDCL